MNNSDPAKGMERFDVHREDAKIPTDDLKPNSRNIDPDNTASTAKRSLLLALPRELRDKNFGYLLVAEIPLRILTPNPYIRLAHRRIDTQIFRVNHQIHTEASAVHYGKNTFFFSMFSYVKLTKSKLGIMSRVSRMQLNTYPRTKIYLMNIVDAIKSPIKPLRVLTVCLNLDSQDLDEREGFGKDLRSVFGTLQHVQVNGSVEFEVSYWCDRAWQFRNRTIGFERQQLFEQGLEDLAKVMAGSLSAGEFDWTNYKSPRCPRRIPLHSARIVASRR